MIRSVLYASLILHIASSTFVMAVEQEIIGSAASISYRTASPRSLASHLSGRAMKTLPKEEQDYLIDLISETKQKDSSNIVPPSALPLLTKHMKKLAELVEERAPEYNLKARQIQEHILGLLQDNLATHQDVAFAYAATLGILSLKEFEFADAKTSLHHDPKFWIHTDKESFEEAELSERPKIFYLTAETVYNQFIKNVMTSFFPVMSSKGWVDLEVLNMCIANGLTPLGVAIQGDYVTEKGFFTSFDGFKRQTLLHFFLHDLFHGDQLFNVEKDYAQNIKPFDISRIKRNTKLAHKAFYSNTKNGIYNTFDGQVPFFIVFHEELSRRTAEYALTEVLNKVKKRYFPCPNSNLGIDSPREYLARLIARNALKFSYEFGMPCTVFSPEEIVGENIESIDQDIPLEEATDLVIKNKKYIRLSKRVTEIPTTKTYAKISKEITDLWRAHQNFTGADPNRSLTLTQKAKELIEALEKFCGLLK